VEVAAGRGRGVAVGGGPVAGSRVRSSLPLRLGERLARGRDLAGVLELDGLAVGALGLVLAEELAELIAAAGYPLLEEDELGGRRRPS
jgi:hypothetical protein